MLELASWGENDHENSGGPAQNYMDPNLAAFIRSLCSIMDMHQFQ